MDFLRYVAHLISLFCSQSPTTFIKRARAMGLPWVKISATLGWLEYPMTGRCYTYWLVIQTPVCKRYFLVGNPFLTGNRQRDIARHRKIIATMTRFADRLFLQAFNLNMNIEINRASFAT